MADPLSISAGIVAVVQVSVTVFKYLGDVQSTTRDVGRLKIEIDGLQTVLLPALDHLRRDQDDKAVLMRFLHAQNGPLRELRTMLESMEKKLSLSAGSSKARRAVTWPFQKSEIADIVAKIERQKILFILTLQLDHYELLQEIRELCLRTQKKTIELAEILAKSPQGLEGAVGGLSCSTENDAIWGPAIHYGNNYGACNVVYGGTQIFTGATMNFGT